MDGLGEAQAYIPDATRTLASTDVIALGEWYSIPPGDHRNYTAVLTLTTAL
jgi:hypothetical protein